MARPLENGAAALRRFPLTRRRFYAELLHNMGKKLSKGMMGNAE